LRLVLALVALVAIACGGESKPVADERIMAFDTATVRLASRRDTMRLSLELARSRAQQTMGLMERRQLAETAGMLFVYDSTQAPDAGFWMYRTRIPLDIAFIDSAGVIRAILPMVPCTATLIEGCPSYPPNVPYHYALEMNTGFFARHGIGVGDALLVGDIASGRGK
jgi:uncharacterized membrane protein (UPF0127 family)